MRKAGPRVTPGVTRLRNVGGQRLLGRWGRSAPKKPNHKRTFRTRQPTCPNVARRPTKSGPSAIREPQTTCQRPKCCADRTSKTPVLQPYPQAMIRPALSKCELRNQREMLENPDPTISYPTENYPANSTRISVNCVKLAFQHFGANPSRPTPICAKIEKLSPGIPAGQSPSLTQLSATYARNSGLIGLSARACPPLSPLGNVDPVQPVILTLTALRPPLACPQIPTCAPDCRSCALRDGTGGRSRRPHRSAPSRPRAVPRYGHCGRPVA